jgi:hypothetical protein
VIRSWTTPSRQRSSLAGRDGRFIAGWAGRAWPPWRPSRRSTRGPAC